MLFWKKKPKDQPQPPAPEPPAEVIPAIPEPMEPAPPEPAPKRGLFAKLRDSLARTHASIWDRAAALFRGGVKLDDASLEELEEILLTADVGMTTTQHLVAGLRERAKRFREKEVPGDWAMATLKELVLDELSHEAAAPVLAPQPPTIVLVVGVNGVGKTTAIGKLAGRYIREGRKVLVIAGDTFRAAAAEQLTIWAQRAECEIHAAHAGADPASVVYDGLAKARTTGAEMVIIDTAGRLHTKTHLMAELSKIRRVIERDNPGAPHETLLVLDASTGQNGLVQAKVFTEATAVTGVVLTKLDGTAKGGVTIAIRRELGLPVKWIGVGEKLDDLEPFDPKAFAEAIFNA